MMANATYCAARQSVGMLGQPSKTCGNGSGLPGKPGRGRMMLKLAAIWAMPAYLCGRSNSTVLGTTRNE